MKSGLPVAFFAGEEDGGRRRGRERLRSRCEPAADLFGGFRDAFRGLRGGVENMLSQLLMERKAINYRSKL
ncbi:hypothetical protein BHE74_00006666 [Ensete ventricosum]|nr:hypothetical protein GW17_00004752 [Ensete ventricosum]RWW84715.1 hypothetical protein BHE74_00006666 [Ensete ventricosum]